MRIATFAVLLIPIICGGSCAHATTLRVATNLPDQRISVVGDDIAVHPGPVLTGLPLDQRYRFVPAESLVVGLAAADGSSVEEPRLGELRRMFSSAMEDGRWVESADAVQFDVTIFTTARLTMRRETRPQLAANSRTCGDRATTELQWCTDDPLLHTEQWNTEYDTFHIIRRRSDGAVRVWRHSGVGASAFGVRVAADLREMFRAGA